MHILEKRQGSFFKIAEAGPGESSILKKKFIP